MVDWVFRKTSSIAKVPVLWTLIVLMIVFTLGLFPLTHKHYECITTLDGTPGGFSPAQAGEILGKFTPEQLGHYLKQERYTDSAFPIVYSLTFAVLIVMGIRCTGKPRW